MNVLISGGAGFIGNHLVNSLLKENNNISILDNFHENKNDIIQDFKNKGVHVLVNDITNFDSLQNLPDVDILIHLAAKVSVKESVNHPELINDVNVTGSLNLLRYCKENGIQNFIAASSASVYGMSNDFPLKETSIPIPMSPYGASKLAMESYMKSFAYSFEMNCISLRFFNIYGKGQSLVYGGVIKKFQDKINQNKPLEILGDGNNTRDFVHIDDVVNSINLSIKYIENKKGTVYNIGSGNATSINEIADMMLKISRKNLQIIRKPEMKGDITHSLSSIELAKNELGYVPKVELVQGLENLFASI